MDLYILTVYIFSCIVLSPSMQEMCILDSLFQDSEVKLVFISTPVSYSSSSNCAIAGNILELFELIKFSQQLFVTSNADIHHFIMIIMHVTACAQLHLCSS